MFADDRPIDVGQGHRTVQDHEDEVGLALPGTRERNARRLDRIVRRARPAVSASSTGQPSSAVLAVTTSRVVPGVASTMARLYPVRAFRSRLLPTFGRPARTTRQPAIGEADTRPGQQGIHEVKGHHGIVGQGGEYLADVGLEGSLGLFEENLGRADRGGPGQVDDASAAIADLASCLIHATGRRNSAPSATSASVTSETARSRRARTLLPRAARAQ